MTIKQTEAVKAYQSLKDLNKQKLSSGKLAKQIYDLTAKLKSAYDFQVQEEQKIFELHPDFDPIVGGIRLDGKTDEEKAIASEEIKTMNRELESISDLDFELEDYEPFELKFDSEPDLKISGEDIGNLEKLIKFI